MNEPLLRLAVLNTTIFGFLKLHDAHKHNLAHAPTSPEIEETLNQSLQQHSINEFLETFACIRDRSCPPGRQIDWAVVAHVADYLWLRSVLAGLPPSYPHNKPAWQLVLVVLRRHFPFPDEKQLVPKDVHELISCIDSEENLDAVTYHNIISRVCNGKDSQGRAEIVACKDMVDKKRALWNAIVGDDDDEDAIDAQFMGYHERRQDSANDIENDDDAILAQLMGHHEQWPDNANDIEDDELPDPNDQLLQEMKIHAIQNLHQVGNKDLRELREEALGIVARAKEITKQIKGRKAHRSRTLGARLAVSDNDYQKILQSGKEHIIEQLHKKLGKDEKDEEDEDVKEEENYDPFSQTCPQKAPEDADTDIDESQPKVESETNDRDNSHVSQGSVYGNNKNNVDSLYELSTIGSGATTDRRENMREQVATTTEEQTAVNEQAMPEEQAAVDEQATAEDQNATEGQATDEKQAATDERVITEREATAEGRAATKEQTAAEESVTASDQAAAKGQVATEEQATIEGCVAVQAEQVADDEQAAVGNSSDSGIPRELSAYGEISVDLTTEKREEEVTANLQYTVNAETSMDPDDMTYQDTLVDSKARYEIDDVEVPDQQISADSGLGKCPSPGLQNKKRKWATDGENGRQRKRREAEAGSGSGKCPSPGLQDKKRKWATDGENGRQRKRREAEKMTPELDQEPKKRPQKGGKRRAEQYSASCYYAPNLQSSCDSCEEVQKSPVPFGDVEPVHFRVTSDMSMVIYRLFPRKTARAMIGNCLKLLEQRDYVGYYALLYTTLRDHPNIKEETMPQSTAAILNKIHEQFSMLPNAPNQTQVEDAIRNDQPQFPLLIYDRIGPLLVAQRDSFRVWKSILQDCDQLLQLQTICLKLYNLIAQGQINDTQSFDAMAFEKSMMAALKQSSCALMIIRIVKSGMISCGVEFQDCNPVTEEEFQTLFSRIHVAFAKLKKQKCSDGMYMANAVPARTDRAQRRSRSTLTSTRRRGLTLLTPAAIKTQIDVRKQPKTHTDPVVKAATAAAASYKSPKLLKIKEGVFIRSSLKPSNALRDSQKEKHLQLANCVAVVDERTAKNMQECLERPGREEEYYLLLLSLVRTKQIHLHILPESARQILSPVLSDDLETTVRVDSAVEWQLSRWFLLLRPWRPSQYYQDTDAEWAEMLAQYGGSGSVEFRAAFETVLADFRATIRLEVGDLLEYESHCLEIARLRNEIGNKVVREAGTPPHGHKSSPPSASLSGAVDQMLTENSPILFESEAVENATPSLANPAFQDSSVSMEGIQFSNNDTNTEFVSEIQVEVSCSDNATQRENILQSDATAEIEVERGYSQAARKRALSLDRATQMGGNLASGNDAQRDTTLGSHETRGTKAFNSTGTTQMERPLTSGTTTQTGTQIKAVLDSHQVMQTEALYTDSGTQVTSTSTSDRHTQTKTIPITDQAMQTEFLCADSGTQMYGASTSDRHTQTKTIPITDQAMQTEFLCADSGTQMYGASTSDRHTQTKTIPITDQAMQTEFLCADSGTQMYGTSTSDNISFQQLTQTRLMQSAPTCQELPELERRQCPGLKQDSTKTSRDCAPGTEAEQLKPQTASTKGRLGNDTSPQQGSTATETELVRLRKDIGTVSEEVHLSLADALAGKPTRPPEPISKDVVIDLDLRNLSLAVLNGFYSLASRCTAQQDAFHHMIQQEKDVGKMQLELLKATATTRKPGQTQDSVDLQIYKESVARFLQIMAMTAPPYPHRGAMEPEDLMNALAAASGVELNKISAECTAAVVQCIRRCLGDDCGAQRQQQRDREALARFKHILRTIEKRFHQAANMLGTGWKGEKAFLSMIDRRVLSEFRRALELQDGEASELVEAVLAILQFSERRRSLSARNDFHLRIPDQTPITVDNTQWFILGVTTDSAKPHNRCDVIMVQARTQRGGDGMQLQTRMENMTKLLRRLDARGAATVAEQIYHFCARESIRTNQLPLGVRAKDIVCSGDRYMLQLRDLATPQGPYTARILKQLGAHLQGWMGVVPGQEQGESYCRPTQHASAPVLIVANY